MADRLKDLMTAELHNLLSERDDYRRKSLQYKDAAEKVDKQVNRLQHFLSDYEVQDLNIPEKKQEKKGGRMLGVSEEILNLLTTHTSLTRREIIKGVEDRGFKGSSVSSALERHIKNDLVEVVEIDRRKHYSRKGHNVPHE